MYVKEAIFLVCLISASAARAVSGPVFGAILLGSIWTSNICCLIAIQKYPEKCKEALKKIPCCVREEHYSAGEKKLLIESQPVRSQLSREVQEDFLSKD